jgi:acyl-ACP thioesterase
MPADRFTELVARPKGGRAYTMAARPGMADCAPSGRIRLDALARWLQDIAFADVEDAGLADRAVWVVRRTRLKVRRFPRFSERCTLVTYCSGLGRMWAERRTTITNSVTEEPEVEAVSLWVHLDPHTRLPSPLTEAELEAYGTAAAGRRVRARLRQPGPGPGPGPGDGGSERWPWTFRATECDLAGHINNAAFWQPLEEQLLRGTDPDGLDVELEYRNPLQPGEKVVITEGNRLWIVDEQSEVHASLVFKTNGRLIAR